MLKRITCIIAVLLLILPLTFVSVNSYAYVSAPDLYNLSNDFKNIPNDGIVIIHRLYQSNYSPDIIDAPEKLDTSFFRSGTWNGKDVSELGETFNLFNIEAAGFSQVVSYSQKNNNFVYSLITCIPVKAGDNFSIYSNYDSKYVKSATSFISSYIPYGSGLRLVHAEMGNEHPEQLTYTVNSKNQHLFSVVSSSTVNKNVFSVSSIPFAGGFVYSLGSIRFYGCNVYTNSYNYSGEISITVTDEVTDYSFSVYEILTDGTTTPGYNTEGSGDSGGGTGGDSGGGDGDETSKNIFESVKGIAGKIGDILTSIKNLPTNIATSIQGFFNDIKVSITTTIDGLKEHLVYLFVPSDNNNFNKCKELINEKFKFIDQITETFSNFVDMVSNPPEAAAIDEDGGHGGGGSYRDFNGPKTAIDFDVYGKKFEVNFMNWDLYDKYKPVIDNIIVFCAWFFFLQRLIRRIPRIIGGFT